MVLAAFDAYAAAKTLRDAGFDESRAEAAVFMVRDAVADGGAKADVTGLKADVAELKADFKAEIVRLEGRVETGLASPENRMLEFAIGIAAANAAPTVALMKLPP